MVPFSKTKIVTTFLNTKQQLYHKMAIRNINFHHIFSRFLWQGDYYYYSDILFLLFLRNNHQFLPNIKLPVALNLIKKVIFFCVKMVAFSNCRVLTEFLSYTHLSILLHEMNLSNINSHQILSSFHVGSAKLLSGSSK